jgi:cytochrome c biogenesis protein ResB
MKKMFFLSAILLCSVAVCLATTMSLNGAWYGTLKTDDGTEYPLQYKFKVDGDKLTGTAKGPHGDLPILDGKINGNDFSFSVTLEKMYLEHSGKIYPDSISLNIEAGDNKAHTVLKRGDN